MNPTRLERLKAAMNKANLDAVFVSNPKNVMYLTGFKTMLPGGIQSFGDPEGFVLVHSDRSDFLCDGRYIEGAKQLQGVTAQLLDSPINAETIARKIVSLVPRGTKTLGIEQDSLLYCDGMGLSQYVKGLALKPAEDVFTDLRIRKTPEEIGLIRKAQDITCACFDHIAKTIRIGMSERDVALEVEHFMKRNSEGCSFDTIVAFGETGCHPHYIPDKNRKLQKGQMVLLDFGAVYEGYAGDMTRMLVMGQATPRHHEVYNLVLEAQLAGLAAVRAGVTGHDIDTAVRAVFEKHKCLEQFMHGTGHGVGLAVHEPPRIKIGFTTVIEPGMVFSIEPGLYYPGWGGVRIEDLVVATEKGHENLTVSSKKLLEVNA
jgi:Xaa-Pro aminopeptidase